MSTTEPCPKCVANGGDTRGNNLVNFHNGHKHCFACHHHVFPKTAFSPLKENHGPKSLLPFDFTREVPGHAWKWLLQWGLGALYWKASVGYSPSQERLIFRVGDTSKCGDILTRNNAPLAFSIGRYLPKENGGAQLPQSAAVPNQVRDFLLQRGGRASVQRDKVPAKWLSYGDCHRHAEVIEGDKGSPVILVEDLISGHKVAAAGYTSIPLFGTKVSNPVMYYLLQSNKPVALWLDKDQELNVKKEALHLQGLLNVPVIVITTDKDPKALSIDEIKGRLK